jgi:hypothetical protein
MPTTQDTSRLIKAHSKAESIRTTVPRRIIEDFNLNAGDTLKWDSFTDKDRKYIRVRKLE